MKKIETLKWKLVFTILIYYSIINPLAWLCDFFPSYLWSPRAWLLYPLTLNGFNFLIFIMVLYFVMGYGNVEKNVKYYKTRNEAEEYRTPPDKILYEKDKGYYIKEIERPFWDD